MTRFRRDAADLKTTVMGRRHRSGGFTLVELLVTITLIVVLAALTFAGVSRFRLAAAKTRTTSQLRQIATAVQLWAGEKNNNEPFYAANGTGTYSHEAVPGSDPVLAPGNPGMLLFNKQSPDDGYLTDITLLFCPLVDVKPPQRQDYQPDAATTTKPWGTFAWYYPSTTGNELTERQKKAMGTTNWAVSTISNAANHKMMLASDYTNFDPKFKPVYLVLMADSSVQEVAQTQAGFKRWAWEN